MTFIDCSVAIASRNDEKEKRYFSLFSPLTFYLLFYAINNPVYKYGIVNFLLQPVFKRKINQLRKNKKLEIWQEMRYHIIVDVIRLKEKDNEVFKE